MTSIGSPLQFGALKRLDPRTLWPKEAYDFTPWLAQNLDALGEALGMELELDETEAACGDFSLDILARDLNHDHIVVIENQLTSTDHDHLGKLITYAAGYDAGSAVWIAPEFREEHREALDWLNRRSDSETNFFGIVVEALQIDSSLPAYNFRLVAMPNEWRKTKVGSAAPSTKAAAYQEFFQHLIDELREKSFTGARMGQPQNWYSFASGVSGVTYTVTFAQHGRVRAEFYISGGDSVANKAQFDALEAHRAALEGKFGEPLTWERLNDRIASRISVSRPGSIDDSAEGLAEVREWLVARLMRMKEVFGPTLK